MHDRTLLGPADVTDERLATLVAAQHGVDTARLLSSDAEAVPYAIPAITTAGRFWVTGRAEAGGREVDFRFFVKHVQSWARSAEFEAARAFLSPEMLEWAVASVPWRTEPLAYCSDLGARLPEGLVMPHAYAVDDLDEDSAALWLEPIDVDPVTWDASRYAEAAYLMGRVAASAAISQLGEISVAFRVRDYADGRLRHQVVPILGDEQVWHHPLVAETFDAPLRDGLLACTDRVSAYADELDAMPILNAHGDACPNNLLVRRGTAGFTLIDYAWWHRMPVGFDLAQLLVGDVVIGRCSADGIDELADTLLAAYVEGLRAEGCHLPTSVVRRAHALGLMLFTGLSTLPFELLDAEPTPALLDLASQRAAVARFSLDLLGATT